MLGWLVDFPFSCVHLETVDASFLVFTTSIHIPYRVCFLSAACAYIPIASEVGLIIQDALNKQVKISGCGLLCAPLRTLRER